MYPAPVKIKLLLRPFWKPRVDRQKSAENCLVPFADELQRRYLGGVLNYVAGRIPRNDTAEAEDITAEVFAAAFASRRHCPVPVIKHVATSPGDHDPVRAWLFGIARRKIADSYRRRGRKPEAAFVDVPENHPAPLAQTPEPQVLAGEANQTLYTLLSSLPEEQREALHLRYIDELSVGEIGQILGKSPNATAQLLHRARQAMRVRGTGYFGADFGISLDTEEQK